MKTFLLYEFERDSKIYVHIANTIKSKIFDRIEIKPSFSSDLFKIILVIHLVKNKKS